MKRLWKLFASIEFTVLLAVLICIDGVVGSLLTVKYRDFYQVLDQAVLMPKLLSFGTEDLSLTAWIYVLIILTALFSVNTAVCTVDRLYSIFKNKTPWQALCPHVVHIGFLIAVLGHLAGTTMGFKEPYNMAVEGERIEVPGTSGVELRLDDMEIRTTREGRLDYLRTDVTLLDGEREIKKGSLSMNSPLFYKGIAFYHLSQGEMPTGLKLDIEGTEREVPFDSTFTHESKKFTMARVFPDFVMTNDGQAYSRSREYRNPYQEIIGEGGKRAYLGIFPGSSVELSGTTISYSDVAFKSYAIVSINKDPGIWLIIIGSSVLTIGIVMIFLFRVGKAELMREQKRPI